MQSRCFCRSTFDCVDTCHDLGPLLPAAPARWQAFIFLVIMVAFSGNLPGMPQAGLAQVWVHELMCIWITQGMR